MCDHVHQWLDSQVSFRDTTRLFQALAFDTYVIPSFEVRSLQLPDGSFANRSGSNEGDCRFTFAALCALKLLARLENNDRKESLDTRCLKRSDVPSTVPRCFGVLEGAQKNSERSEDCGFDSAEDTIVSILFDR